MFQIVDYIVKALVEESEGDNEFLTDAELSFRVNGMMYTDGIKSNGAVSLRNIRGKLPAARTMCDVSGLLMLPKVEKSEEGHMEVTAWKVAIPDDLEYIGEVFMDITESDLDGVKVKKATAPEVEKESLDD